VETRTAPLIGGRYRINGLLGEGGMARVFDAFDERLGRRAAVKILRAETRALPGMRQRFQQEALIAARLVHPHIVAVLDFGEDHASSYLVMEHLPGTTLRDEIVARGPLSTQRVMLVMGETLDALAAAHARRVLHRDIKPSNILLQQNGHTKITDFGIAKSFDIRTDPAPTTDDMTMTGVVLGTPGYLAPERRSGHPATVQSDLYAVGAVMVEALTGQRLGSGPAPMETLPPALREVARRVMAADPRDRFTSADEMARTLGTGSGGRPAHRAAPAQGPATTTVPAAVPPRRPSPVPGTAIVTAPRPRRPRDRRARVRRRRLIGAAVVLLAVAGALFVAFWSGTKPTGPAASPAKHVRTQALTRPAPKPPDTEGSAITALATALAGGGLPGDGALASVLQETAAAAPGAARQASAQQALSLAGVLLGGGAITPGQYQDVANVLQPTGATTTTTTTSTVTVPTQPFQTPSFQGHGHDHERKYDGGGQG
jgi:eukaryotic-like serine/threonine-protein kinase